MQKGTCTPKVSRARGCQERMEAERETWVVRNIQDHIGHFGILSSS